MNVRFINGYTPHGGDIFRLINAGGTFNAASLTVNFLNAPPNMTFIKSIGAHGMSFTAVPEPSTFLLAGAAGLMGLAYWRRRATATI